MRIAVVGSGIAGMGAAWLLSRAHEVVLFEADQRLGGHTHTHQVWHEGRPHAVDSGFIVHNRENYPLLTRMFAELGVATHDTTMSFSVHDERSGLQYNAGSLNGLFCQRRNLLSPRFWGMLRDIFRFYREAPALLDESGAGPTLEDYLETHRYGAMFIHDHLIPMASALWSSPSQRVLQFPAKYMVQFMANHCMLQANGRPAWRVVSGGSQRYVDALVSTWPVQVRLNTPVRRVVRHADGVTLLTEHGPESFDQVVVACHSDQALGLLQDASEREQAILGAITYQENDTVLHTDRRLLPPDRRAWAAWNAHVPADPNDACTVSYCMNLLQGISSSEPFVVTLNRSAAIDPAKVIARMRYAHPEYTLASVAARARRHEINGVDRVWFCGAYWGWGFHEDGLRSAVDVAAALGVRWVPT
ncbi:MAG: FAD-dependent oxidoreductase [Lysobacteraceae bacterium]